MVCRVFVAQNIHSSWVIGKILFLKELGPASAGPLFISYVILSLAKWVNCFAVSRDLFFEVEVVFFVLVIRI